ncbi:MAG: hypothetical protein LBQ00_04785 [Syntrophobacterales bacterium]|jgi:hypothetical protein|nr:hypothetical protein [Syntrophobacterales bacterium]
MIQHYTWIIAFIGTFVVVPSNSFWGISYLAILPMFSSAKEDLAFGYTQRGLISIRNFIGLCLVVIGGFIAARFKIMISAFAFLLIIDLSLFFTDFSESFGFAFLTRLIIGMGHGPRFIKRNCLDGWHYAWYVMESVACILYFLPYVFLRYHLGKKGLRTYRDGKKPETSPNITRFTAFLSQKIDLSLKNVGEAFAALGFFGIFFSIAWGKISDVQGRIHKAMFTYLTPALSYLLSTLMFSCGNNRLYCAQKKIFTTNNKYKSGGTVWTTKQRALL